MSALLATVLVSPALAETGALPAGISTGTATSVRTSTAPAAVTPSTATAVLPAASTATAAALWPASAAPAAVPRPWVLGEITASGNKNVKLGVIRGQVKARKGDLYDRPDLDRDVQLLLELGNFERVAADVTLMDKPVPAHLHRVAGADRMVRLTFLVKEKPLIKKIKFNGNKKLSRSALEDATTLKAKDPLDETKLRDDQDKLLAKYREKGFLDATARYEIARDTAALQADINWFIAEGAKSYIALVAIDGAATYAPRKLRERQDLLELKARLAHKEDMTEFVELLQRPKDIRKRPQDLARLLELLRQPKSLLDQPKELRRLLARAQLLADLEQPQALLKLMKNRTKGWFRGGVFVEKELPEDAKKIVEFYHNHGYLDVNLSTPAVTVSTDKTRIAITMSVAEGRSYRFGETSFAGNIIYTSTDLAKALDYHRNGIFNQEKFDASLRAVQELYAEKGRLKAKATPTKNFNKATDRMDVEIGIVEGNIIYIDHVDVEGNKATKSYVLRREVVIKPGDAFSLSRIRKSRERIMNLGFLDDVGVDIQPTADPDKVDLSFDVTEGKPGMLTAGAAYSSLDGLVGTLSLKHMNLFGRAQQGSLQWSFGKRVQDLSASWTTPWVADKPMSLGGDAFHTSRISPYSSSLSAYTLTRTGGTIRLGPRFEEDKYRLSLSYTLSQNSIKNVQTNFLNTLTPGTSLYSTLATEFARDTRDSIWDPTHGTRNALGFSLTGGPLFGQVNVFEPSGSNAAYFTPFTIGDEEWPVVLGFSNRAAYVTQFGATKEVPVFDRFIVGGQDSLRGYNATGEAGFPTGGKIYDIFNIELGVPVAREHKKSIVKLVAFFDMGSSWDRAKDISLRVGPDTRDLKTDAGLGIRFVTPAFPIRLDWGYGFNHRPGERLYQINFGMGNLF